MPDLDQLVAGILLLHAGWHPGAAVDLVVELARHHRVTREELLEMLARLEIEHGLIVEITADDYRVAEWERRYRVSRGFGGVPMLRDEASGRYVKQAVLRS